MRRGPDAREKKISSSKSHAKSITARISPITGLEFSEWPSSILSHCVSAKIGGGHNPHAMAVDYDVYRFSRYVLDFLSTG